MLLSVRCARAIGPFGEELCALQEGLPRKSTAKLPRSSGPFVEDLRKREKVSTGYYASDRFVLK